MKNKHWIITILVLAALVVVASIHAQRNQSATATPGARPVPVVEVRTYTPGIVREFPGKVQANRRVNLAFSVPGVLSELNASEGSTFQKGEVIARLDNRDYKYARNIAVAAHAEAEAAFERKQKLFDEQVISQSDLDRAEAAYRMAAGELEIRQKAFADTILKAPFDGVIARRFVENHEHIQPQAPIVSLQDVTVVQVVVQLPEILVAHGGLDNLRTVKVSFDADGGRLFDAGIVEFSSQADPTTRTYEAVVELTPPENLLILPGMTATVRVNTSEVTGAPVKTSCLVPIEAVWGGPQNQSFVWVIDDSRQRAIKTAVTTGNVRNNEIEVMDGLTAGQKVAIAGIHSLNETIKVRSTDREINGLPL